MRPPRKWPINPGSNPQPFDLHLSETVVSDHEWTYSITASVPGVYNDLIVRHERILRIQWNVLWDTGLESWKSVEHFSMLPYIAVPRNGIEFLQSFIVFLETAWLEMCGINQSKLGKSVSWEKTTWDSRNNPNHARVLITPECSAATSSARKAVTRNSWMNSCMTGKNG
jgi:hypothetical protein